MTTDTSTTQRSRRNLLAAGLGAAAAAVAATVARVTPTMAADGDPAIVGTENSADTVTVFSTDISNALTGVSNEGRGLSGKSTAGQGVHGQSDQVAGVAGLSDSGAGVHGRSTSNRGVFGESESGAGIEGTGTVGVQASGAVGVQAASSDGYALQTTAGRVRFEGISGVAVIEPGETEAVIDAPVDINDNTIVFLTGQADNGGRSLWFSRNSDENKVFVRMSTPRNNPTRVAYLILEHASA